MNALNMTSQTVVCRSLTEEHHKVSLRLDALESCLSGFQHESVSSETRDEMAEILKLLNQDMEVHFACEEKGLFPVLSMYHPMVLMEVEHEELIDLKNKLDAAFEKSKISDESNQKVWEVGYLFIKYLREHISREDVGIFPLAEQCLTEPEKQLVISQMQALRRHVETIDSLPLTRSKKQFYPVTITNIHPIEKPVDIQRLLEMPSVTIKQISLGRGKSLDAHWSPKHIFLFCIQGSAEFKAENQLYPLRPGVGLLVEPRLLHELRACEDSQFLLLALDFQPVQRCKKQCH